jgi:hypothetical protein
MNKLHVGFSREIELPKGGFLLIDDQVRDIPRSHIFDPLTILLKNLAAVAVVIPTRRSAVIPTKWLHLFSGQR